MIKYKGLTSELLKDLCNELNIPVNLKQGEDILKHYFQLAFQDLNTDKSIEVISSLPACIKPFYLFSKSNPCIENRNENQITVSFKNDKETLEFLDTHFNQKKLVVTTKAILKVLDKFIPAQNLAIVLSCIPERFFCETHLPTPKVAV